MALTPKTPSVSLHPKTSNPKITEPKTLNFSLKLKTHKILLVKPLKNSFICSTSTSTTTEDPNSQLHQLCLSGNLEKAVNALSSMQEQRISAEEETLIVLVRLCEQKRASDKSDKLYLYVSKTMTRLSFKLGNALLSMFVRFGNLDNAWFVFGKMEEMDLFSWNVLVGGYAKAGFFDQALSLYHRMLWVGMKPDVYNDSH